MALYFYEYLGIQIWYNENSASVLAPAMGKRHCKREIGLSTTIKCGQLTVHFLLPISRILLSCKRTSMFLSVSNVMEPS